MGKKISETDRLMDFALNASEEGLQTAIDTLKSVQRNKYAQKPPKVRKTKAEKEADKALKEANKAASASGD